MTPIKFNDETRGARTAWRRLASSAVLLLASLGGASVPAAEPAAVDHVEGVPHGFHHGMALVNGVRLHYVEGGSGRPVLLIPGWPQSWYAWRDVMPGLAAAGHRVIAVDPRGMGDSDHPQTGYDAATVAADLHGLVLALGLDKDGPLDVVGHDVGAWIAFAYAADWPADVRKLALMEAALLGVSPAAPAGIPSETANVRTWHFAFNRLPDLPEMLVAGHEREYLGWLFAKKSARPWVFTPGVLAEYTRVFAQPGGPRTAFAYYRAAFGDEALDANRSRAKRGLKMPVLALGGQWGVGATLRDTMRQVAPQVHGDVVAGCGHFVMEECPAEVLSQLAPFLGAP